MKLHNNEKLFRDAIRFTAQQMNNLQPEYVEKDYWVTYALQVIFNHEIGKDTIFKGGTALSKCFKLIERFSEDIDLFVLRHKGESDNKLKSKLKTIGYAVNRFLPEIEIPGITNKKGMNRRTAHTYLKKFFGNYGQIRDVIIIEATWLGHQEPYTSKMATSLVGEIMLANGQTNIVEDYGLLPFDVKVLEPARTFCEKIMSLVRFSYEINPIDELKKKIRHTYDLHKLLQQNEFSEFLNSTAFVQMLTKVASDDVVSFRNNNEWLMHHPYEALIFSDLDSVWTQLTPVYNGIFKDLVYGVLPDEAAVFETLKKIRERLADIEWQIQIESKRC